MWPLGYWSDVAWHCDGGGSLSQCQLSVTSVSKVINGPSSVNIYPSSSIPYMNWRKNIFNYINGERKLGKGPFKPTQDWPPPHSSLFFFLLSLFCELKLGCTGKKCWVPSQSIDVGAWGMMMTQSSAFWFFSCSLGFLRPYLVGSVCFDLIKKGSYLTICGPHCCYNPFLELQNKYTTYK